MLQFRRGRMFRLVKRHLDLLFLEACLLVERHLVPSAVEYQLVASEGETDVFQLIHDSAMRQG